MTGIDVIYCCTVIYPYPFSLSPSPPSPIYLNAFPTFRYSAQKRFAVSSGNVIGAVTSRNQFPAEVPFFLFPSHLSSLLSSPLLTSPLLTSPLTSSYLTSLPSSALLQVVRQFGHKSWCELACTCCYIGFKRPNTCCKGHSQVGATLSSPLSPLHSLL